MPPIESSDMAPQGDFWVGSSLVQPGRLEVTTNGQRTQLSPRDMAVLVYLKERASRFVSSSELLEAVWSEADVNQEVVYQATHALREALADTPRDSRVLRTVRGRGYRLVAPIREYDKGEDLEPLDEASRQLRAATMRLIKGSQVPLLFLDPYTVLRFCNDAFSDIVGIREEELVGLSLFQFMERLKPRIPADRWEAFLERQKQGTHEAVERVLPDYSDEEYFDNRGLSGRYQGRYLIRLYAWRVFSEPTGSAIGTVALYQAFPVDEIPGSD